METSNQTYLPALVAIHGLSPSAGYSLADVAKLLTTTETAITKMFRQGKLTPLRTHRNRFSGVLSKDLERYLEDVNRNATERAATVSPSVTAPSPSVEQPTNSAQPVRSSPASSSAPNPVKSINPLTGRPRTPPPGYHARMQTGTASSVADEEY